MAGLLVSVRSAEEARAAVEGGASVIDVKEPDRGPLGRATPEIWQAVRKVVPARIPVSVALGELCDWESPRRSIEGIAYQKLGLAGAGPEWRTKWAEIRRLEAIGPRWVAVAYADWRRAGAPNPGAVLQAALAIPDCSGVLVDTWDKTKPSPLDLTPDWTEWVGRAQKSGRFVTLAGGLNPASIVRLAPLRPDFFAVRGAACDRSDRRSTVRRELVAELVQSIQMLVPR